MSTADSRFGEVGQIPSLGFLGALLPRRLHEDGAAAVVREVFEVHVRRLAGFCEERPDGALHPGNVDALTLRQAVRDDGVPVEVVVVRPSRMAALTPAAVGVEVGLDFVDGDNGCGHFGGVGGWLPSA